MSEQCPYCYRCDEDWADDSSKLQSTDGSKGKQRKTEEDPTAKYRRWRWEFGGGCYASDIDMVEWRILNGEPTPVAVHELTRLPGNKKPPQKYFDRILERYEKRDGQASSIVRFAAHLGVNAYIVVYRHSLLDFWLYNLTAKRGWKYLTKAEYQQWVRGLKPPVDFKAQEHSPVKIKDWLCVKCQDHYRKPESEYCVFCSTRV